MSIIGVITGDIVNSTSISSKWKDRILQSLETVKNDFSTADMNYEMFRGDSFQVTVQSPTETLLVAIAIRIILISQTPDDSENKWDARVSVGIGDCNYKSSTIVTSDGEAFVLSGRGLDMLRKNRLSIKTTWPEVNNELDISTAFADGIITNMSVKQSVIVYQMLKNYNQNLTMSKLSENLGESISNLSLKWKRAEGNLIINYLKRVEKLIQTNILSN